MKIGDLIESLESCPVGDGDLLGQNFRVLPYQRRFIRGAFRPGVIRAGLSLARGGGKSGLASALCLDAIRPGGVLHRPGFEAVLIASSFSQARIVYEAVKTSLELMEEDWNFRIRDQQNLADIQHKETKARLRVAGADNRRAHGWRTNLIVCDEPSQWGPSGEKLAAAIRTSLGKRKGAKALFIGTRPESDEHFFARLLDEKDDGVYAQVHAAALSDPPFQVKTWRKANPGLDAGLPDINVLRAEARLAKTDENELQSFRALRLNQGVSDTAQRYLMNPEEWKRIESSADHVGPVSWGIDLGTSNAMSAIAGYFPETGALCCVACFPELPDLRERGLKDGVGNLYARMKDRGELIIAGRRASDIRALLREARRRFGNPSSLTCDSWRVAELTDALEKENFPWCVLEQRRQGFRDGAEDIRSFREALALEKVVPEPSLLMTAAFSEARLVADVNANEKLSKGCEGGRRMRAKDDAVAASILAVATGYRKWKHTPPSTGIYMGMTGRP